MSMVSDLAEIVGEDWVITNREQAARYLNQKANPADLTVAVAPIRLFSPFFLGETVKWDEGEERDFIQWRTADYVVRYINFGFFRKH